MVQVIKKLGYRENFNLNKIRIALMRTAKQLDKKFSNSDWKELKPRITSRLEPKLEKDEVFFWEIDDVVIDALLRSRFNDIARQYIQTRSSERKDKLNDLGLSPVAMNLLKERYLRKNNKNEPIETAKEMMCRVGTAVASVEDTQELREKYTEEFNRILVNRDFLPNSPCLVSAGTERKGTWFACFAYAMDDSLKDIFHILHKTARTFQLGGGVGVSIANLREKGSPISGTGGKSSGSVAFLELFDTMCRTVKAGGFRRGALMAINEYNHPDINWFIHCKRNTDTLTNMNISVLVENDFFDSIENEKKVDLISPKTGKKVDEMPAKLMLEKMATNIWETGEPGILFYDRINRDNPTPHLGDITLTNPCLTEDTLIALADGRLFKTIKELANEDENVPIYSYDGSKMVKSTGKNIRKTRENVDVYKIILDDDSSFKATDDHKVMTRDGRYKSLGDLNVGDSLMPFTRYQYNARKHGKYWGILRNNGNWIQEHNLIAGLDKSKTDVVHHKNYNGLDNSPDNLEIISVSDHNELHKNRMLGDKNPMRDGWWNTLSDSEKEKHRNKMSKLMSGKNNPNYKGVMDKPKTINLRTSPDTIYRVMVHCPNCGKEKLIRPSSKQKGYCSIKCYNIHTKTGSGYTKEYLLDCGKKFIKKFKKLPKTSTWEEFSKKKGIPSRETVRKLFGGFQNFRGDLGGNHTIKKIEYVGKEDVYDMRVDNYNNFAIITNPNKLTSKKKMPKHSGIIVHNCSESTLLDGEACILGSINLVNHIDEKNNDLDWDKLSETTKLAVRFLDNTMEASPYPDNHVKEAVLDTRKIGVGVMGFADTLIKLGIKYSSDQTIQMAEKIMSFVQDVADQESKRLAEEKGTYREWKKGYPKRRNAIVTIQAPTGSISLIAGVSPGIEPNFYKEYSRELEGETITIEHPLKDDENFEQANEISGEQHLRILAAFQKYVENSVSKTINVSEDTSVEEIKDLILMAHDLDVKGLTIFRENCNRDALINCADGKCELRNDMS